MIHNHTAVSKVGMCAAGVGMSLLGFLWWSESKTEAQGTEAREYTFTERDLSLIQDRLAQLRDLHRQLLQATEEIKRELAVVKVRVTN